jgi:hypothetical protein
MRIGIKLLLLIIKKVLDDLKKTLRSEDYGVKSTPIYGLCQVRTSGKNK